LEPPARFPKKRLGQHFLKDPNTARIVASGVTENDVVLEIGPGRGFLTTFLAERAKFVHAVELDHDLLQLLEELFGHNENFRLHTGDALAFDYTTLNPAPGKMVANLPYNIASPLVLKLLEEQPCINVMRFMVQYEVARRMVAVRGSKDHGSYAVLVQLLAGVRIEHKVSPQVFDPPPRVHSAVVEMKRREIGLRPGEYEGVKRLVLSAFKSRRKRLANNLPEPVRRETPHALRSIGHRPDARAEELAPEDFVALYRDLSWAL
jgi:16S rRNA (adenine1518-N6/adenine1519-N6)-dimethyltransferase